MRSNGLIFLIIVFICSCQNRKTDNSKYIISNSPYIYYYYDKYGFIYYDERFKQEDTLSNNFNLLGRQLYYNKEKDSAIYILNKGLENSPDNPILLHSLGNIYSSEKDFDNAIINLNKSISVTDSIYFPSIIKLGNIYGTLGEQEKAEKLFYYVINNYKHEIPKGFAHAGLARMYYKYGYIDKAKKEIKIALEYVKNDKTLTKDYLYIERKINDYYK